MNWKLQLSLWAPFAVSSSLTLLVYTTLWAAAWYWVLLSLLGILSGILAARVLAHTGLRRWPVIGVAAGLFLGQWWLVEAVTMQALWSIKGFAP